MGREGLCTQGTSAPRTRKPGEQDTVRATRRHSHFSVCHDRVPVSIDLETRAYLNPRKCTPVGMKAHAQIFSLAICKLVWDDGQVLARLQVKQLQTIYDNIDMAMSDGWMRFWSSKIYTCTADPNLTSSPNLFFMYISFNLLSLSFPR